MRVDECFNVRDLRELARRKVPAPFFTYLDGGSDDQWTLARNSKAFDDYQLMPNTLVDVSSIDLSNTVLGQKMELPFFLAPTGMSRLFHHDRELGAARAAEKFGTMYSLSTVGTTSIEEIAETVSTPKMFQIYVFRDRAFTKEFVDRCKAANYEALCLTVDLPVAGNREGNLRAGHTMPPKPSLATFMGFATKVAWGMGLLKDRQFTFANVAHMADEVKKRGIDLFQFIGEQFDRSLVWDDLAWLAEQWDGPLVIKGILSPDDARRALDAGATAAMISNHGGRQLDSVPAPIDCLRPMRDAVGDKMELIVDGGIERGTQIIKALAMGADACSMGKSYLYGLGAGGQEGVERMFTLLKAELERNMTLLGVTKIDDLNERHIVELCKRG
ncbi:alpha-hydroxy-acid oxidizing enzyme [Kordiimonas sediminis]|uniref:Alpha-hydroxy-acid oxidizing enzyme n=1 Tax=Kordiimonas sediminis TaxID=1735581 RepID=A0A919AR35_9PROT|nr:alpha-hydroxy acid oxidase [Kordiimonas sediminis]GHF20694.1 alpha-hydroxy-acid oxidizing enzyme [Kordiimonas sediminis]